MRRIILPIVECPAVTLSSKLSHKRHDSREKVIERKMCVLDFSTTFVRNISHSKNNSARYCHKCTQVFMCGTHLCSCYIFRKLEIYRQIFEKYWNTKFHENPASGSRVVPCGRTRRS